MPIQIEKHCREAPSAEDGTRLLVMRYWPRGVRKDRFDAWYRDLAPSVQLLKAFKDLREISADGRAVGPGHAGWDQLMARYHTEMRDQQESLRELRGRHARGEVFTLLCGCHEPARCHRSHLAGMILEPATYGLEH